MRRSLPSRQTIVAALLGIAVSAAGFAIYRTVAEQTAFREFSRHAQEEVEYIQDEFNEILLDLAVVGEAVAIDGPANESSVIPIDVSGWNKHGIDAAEWIPIQAARLILRDGPTDDYLDRTKSLTATSLEPDGLWHALADATSAGRPAAVVGNGPAGDGAAQRRPLTVAIPVSGGQKASPPFGRSSLTAGFVVAQISLDSLIMAYRNRIDIIHSSFDTCVFASGRGGMPQIVAQLAPDTAASSGSDSGSTLTIESNAEVAGLSLIISVNMLDGPTRDGSWQPWLALVLGLVFTGFLAYLLEHSVRNEQRIEALVAARTHELEDSNFRLEQTITEHQRAEQALRESEARLREAQHRAKLTYWYWFKATDDYEWSTEAAALLGCTPDCLPMNQDDYMMIVHADDRNWLREIFDQRVDGPSSYEVDYRIVRSDGSVRWIRELAEAETNERGEVFREVGTLQDITEQKRAEAALRESEARLRSFMDNSPVEMVIKDLDGRYALVNRGVEALWKMPAEQIVGRRAAEMTASCPNLDMVETMDQEVLETGRVVARELYFEEWGSQWTHEIKFPIRDESGKMIAIGGVAVDITEQKQTELALIKAKEQAELANSAKGQFLANMSHELRTPLNAIIGFADIISRQLFGSLGNAKYADYAKDIHESGEHLLSIVNSILDSAKIEAGRFDLHEAPCGVDEIVSSSLRMIEERSAQKGLTVSQIIDPSLPIFFADEKAIKQVLINLLSNAMKFTPAGGAIEVSARFAEDGGLSLSVRDSGIGIAPRHLGRLFERFTQADDSYTRVHGGTGLGLYICQKLTELHGGKITLDSQIGHGTTATVTFPPSRWQRVEELNRAAVSAA